MRTIGTVRRNPNATLAGGSLSRSSTVLPEREQGGSLADKPLVQGWLEDERGNRVDPKTIGIRHAPGRPPKPGGAQSPAERKQRQRQRERDWSWLPFDLHADADYLVMENPEDDKRFDFKHCTVITGRELLDELEAHKKAHGDNRRLCLPDGVDPASVPADFPLDTQFSVEFADATPALVLVYPERIRYFIPDIRQKSVNEVLAGKGVWSLNDGRFLKEAPVGLGLLFTGWGHKRGYNRRTSNFEPELEETAAVHGAYQDPDVDPETLEFDEKRDESDSVDSQLEETIETGIPLQDTDTLAPENIAFDGEDTDDAESAEPGPLTCNLCHTTLEDDRQQAIAHIQTMHPKEYQRLRRGTAEWMRKQRKEERQRKRRLEDKHKHCHEDHERMLTSMLEQHGPGVYHCEKCDALLCQHRHAAMCEVKAKDAEARRNAISDAQDRRSFKIGPFYCDICQGVIFVTPFEITLHPSV